MKLFDVLKNTFSIICPNVPDNLYPDLEKLLEKYKGFPPDATLEIGSHTLCSPYARITWTDFYLTPENLPAEEEPSHENSIWVTQATLSLDWEHSAWEERYQQQFEWSHYDEEEV